jgi:hypothetical protein
MCTLFTMMHQHTWTESLGNLLKKTGKGVWKFLRTDLTETRYGHRILDQIFREGKFAQKKRDRHQNSQAH